jgi:hypothetical protein
MQEALSKSHQQLNQKHTRTAAYKQQYELKKKDISTNIQIQENQKHQLQNIPLTEYIKT